MMRRDAFYDTLIDPLSYWSSKSAKEVQELMGPEAARMVEYDQCNPHHCYSLFQHTLHTVDMVGKNVMNLPYDLLRLVKVAAYFHDIGKPEVAKWKDGRMVFYNHPKVSRDISRDILTAMGYEEKELELISFWIAHHDDFISYCLPKGCQEEATSYGTEINQENIHKYLRKRRTKVQALTGYDEMQVWAGLLALCLADSSAQAKEVWMNGVLTMTREDKCNRILAIKALVEQEYGNAGLALRIDQL